MNIEEQIKILRKEKHLSQQEMADKIGMHRVQYTRLELGKSEITVHMLERISKALEVSLVDLIQGNPTEDVNSYDKTLIEKLKMIEQLEENQKKSIFSIIDMAIYNIKLKQTLSNALTINM